MFRYTLSYYHKIVRMPMLTFKRNIYSQIFKRQDQEAIMIELDQEIETKEMLYEEELEMELDDDDDSNGGQAESQKVIEKRLTKIDAKVS